MTIRILHNRSNTSSLDLARELKDAGFPQEIKNGALLWADPVYGPSYYVPTLEELIEACGDGVLMISRNSKNQWFAEKGITLEIITEEGSTPIEAMAGLYISLKN